MLQVELRINGALIDCIDIVNMGHITDLENGIHTEGDCLYTVNKLGNKSKTELIHNRKDGAIKLASMALSAIAKKERK